MTLILALFSLTIPTYAWGRKLVSKPIVGSYYNYFVYSFDATAGITYNDSNQITQISDLSFSNVRITPGVMWTDGSVAPLQKSKTFSGKSATYVIKITRNAMGVYQDCIDYTISYSSTDSGTPYSLVNPSVSEGEFIIVDISEPYDIQYFE